MGAGGIKVSKLGKNTRKLGRIFFFAQKGKNSTPFISILTLKIDRGELLDRP